MAVRDPDAGARWARSLHLTQGDLRAEPAQLGHVRLCQPDRGQPLPRGQRRRGPLRGGVQGHGRRPGGLLELPGQVLRHLGLPGRTVHAVQQRLSRRHRALRRIRHGRDPGR